MAFQRPFLIILKREDVKEPWGLRVAGGADYGTTPTVEKVVEESLAARHGVHEGDLLIQIGKHNVQDLTETRINSILAYPVNKLEIFIVREDFLQKPKKGEPTTVKAVVHNQYNSPLPLYSQEKVAETLALTAQALTEEDGVSENIQPAGLPRSFVQSAVLQAVNEEESAYRTANGTTAAPRKAAAPPPPPKPKPAVYSGGTVEHQRQLSSSSYTVTSPRTPPVQQPPFQQSWSPHSPYQQISQPAFYQNGYQQQYQTQISRQESYEQQRRAQQIQEAQLRQRHYEEERQKQAEYEQQLEAQRQRQLHSPYQEVLRESEEERQRRLYQEAEQQRQLQEWERQREEVEKRRQLYLEQRRREEEKRRLDEEQRRVEQLKRAEEQRKLEEQRRQQETYRRWQEEQQRAQKAAQAQQRQYQQPQQQYQQPKQQYQQQRQPVSRQWNQEEKRPASTPPTSSHQHKDQVGLQTQQWENKIREEKSRMSFSPQGSPATRRRDAAWPPKESNVRWVPKTGFSPQFARQSSKDSKRFIWPPPNQGDVHEEVDGTGRPPSRTAVNAWHPSSPTAATRTPPFARSPSLGRRTKDIAWPPPQPEPAPKPVPKPVSRGLHQPEEFLHHHASSGVPPTYRAPPNSSQYLHQ